MWVEVWVEIRVVWVDKLYVGEILRFLYLTQNFVPYRQLRRGIRKVVGTRSV